MNSPTKIGLLLGAGFSYDLGMPLAKELTDVLLRPFNEQNTRELVQAMSSHCPYGADKPPNQRALTECFDVLLAYRTDGGQNYETMLSQLEALAGRYDRSQSDRDSAHYVLAMLYELIHDILSLYQAASYDILYPKNLRWYSKLGNLLSTNETWIFSLNHDLFLECLAIDLGIPVSYGGMQSKEFPISNREMHERVQFSCVERSRYSATSSGFIRDRAGINLVKLHGSLSEHEYDDKTIFNLDLNRTDSKDLMSAYTNVVKMAYYQNGVKAAAARDRFITNMDGQCDVMSKAMLTGGRKYSTTANPKPGEEKLSVFDAILGELDQLTIIGYGFGDKHVNFRISNAMARREHLSAWIVDPNRNSLPECLEPFDYNSRARRSACGATLWMDYCESKKWDTTQMESLKENVALRKSVRDRVENLLRSGRRP